MSRCFLIGAAERAACSLEERFGGVQATIQFAGDLRDGESVEIPQRQRGPMMRAELRERGQRSVHVDRSVPDVDFVGDIVDFERSFSLVARLSAPMVDEAATGHDDQPSDRPLADHCPPIRGHRRHERLRRQVLGDRAIPAAGE